MTVARLGLIGSGAIVTKLVEVLGRERPAPLEALVCLTSARSEQTATDNITPLGAHVARNVVITSDLAIFLRNTPDLVVEGAGHGSLRDYGPAILERGSNLLVVSTGALCDEELHRKLDAAATLGRSRLILSAGALTSLDFLAVARLSGAEQVDYTSRKPPSAWRGTPAEGLIDLDAIMEPTVFFDGDARTAARDYPRNANVAATIALTGPGFEKTRVRLIADPGAGGNVHEVALRSGCVQTHFRVVGLPSPDNPKTSLSTAFSLAREVLAELHGGAA